jgi:hypothetical protein
MWVIAQTVAVAAGFITAIIAALLREEPLRNSSVLGWSLIVIPVVGSLASRGLTTCQDFSEHRVEKRNLTPETFHQRIAEVLSDGNL